MIVYSKDVYAGDKFFPAGKYDDIFDVDIGSGEIKKIPFNINDNPAEVALKFCERESKVIWILINWLFTPFLLNSRYQ